MTCDRNSAVVKRIKRQRPVEHAHSRPRPETDLSAGIGRALAFGINESRKTVCEISVIRGNFLVAEGDHSIARIDEFLGRLIFIGDVGAEIDMNKGGDGSSRFGYDHSYRERKLAEGAVADQLIYLKLCFTRAESLIPLGKLRAHG